MMLIAIATAALVAAGPYFIDVTERTGLEGVAGSFVTAADYDNDGYVDLLVDGRRLFKNLGPPDYLFIEVTQEAGLEPDSTTHAIGHAVFGDFDNDGCPDLFATGGGFDSDGRAHQPILWRNRCDGTFENVSAKAGIDNPYPAQAAAWADVDRDGFIDLYIANYESADSGTFYPDTLWRNNGDGTFTDVTAAMGIGDDLFPHPGRGVAWADFDNDLWPDAYVANYRLRPNYLWKNLGGARFYDAARERGVQGTGRDGTGAPGDKYYGHTIGVAWGDINNDGFFDLVAANLAHKDLERGPSCDDSKLYLNAGPPAYTFADIRGKAGIPILPVLTDPEDELYSGAAFADFDNDGHLDLFMPQIYNLAHAQGRLYRNNGDLTFTDVAAEAGVQRIDTYASAWADLDNDGCPDLVTAGRAGVGAPVGVRVFLNVCDWKNHWLAARLRGARSNRMAIGAVMRIFRRGEVLTRQVEGGGSSHGQQNSPVLHFGLGREPAIDRVEIAWPSGRVERKTDLKVDAYNEIVEGGTPVPDAIEIIPPGRIIAGVPARFDCLYGYRGRSTLAYLWDFGGRFQWEPAVNAVCATTRTFTTPGTTEVRLRIVDAAGAGREAMTMVTVE